MTHTHLLLEAPGLFAKVPDLARRIAQAVKFDAGTADNLPSVPPDLWRPEYMRLPYPQTVVEFIVEGPESESRIGTRIWTLAMEQVDDAPTPAEPSADVARDAERWRILPQFLEEFQTPYFRLVEKIDAARGRQTKATIAEVKGQS